jgi:hypothetical protein
MVVNSKYREVVKKPYLRLSGGVAAFLCRLIPPTAGLRFFVNRRLACKPDLMF